MPTLASHSAAHPEVTWADALLLLAWLGIFAVAVLFWLWAFASTLSIADSEWRRIGRVQARWVVAVFFVPPLAVYYALAVRPRLLSHS